jgi:hypothetical protein
VERHTQNALFYPPLATQRLSWEGLSVAERLRRVQMVAMMCRAVDAVQFVRWMSAQWHIGLDAGGSAGAATLCDLARPHNPVLARAAGASQTPICHLTWSQKRRLDQLCLG